MTALSKNLSVISILLASSFGVVFAEAASSEDTQELKVEEKGLLTPQRDYKGYPKRHRLIERSFNNYYSPSQLHEVYGLEVDASAEVSNMSVQTTKTQPDFSVVAPGASARALWSGDILVLGLGGDFTNVNINPEGRTMPEDFYNIYQVEPQIATTFNDSVTFGVSSKFTRSQLQENVPLDVIDQTRTVTNDYHVDTYGVSYHNPKMETGLSYSTFAKDTSSYDDQSSDVKKIYIPANTTYFIRGNITDIVSLLGAVSYVEYQRHTLAAEPVFNKYRLEDRLAARAQLSLWAKNRSSWNITGRYTPGTYIGPFIGGINYLHVGHLANLYGGAIEYNYSFNNKKSYLGIGYYFDRGERDQVVDGQRWVRREEQTKIAGSLNLKI